MQQTVNVDKHANLKQKHAVGIKITQQKRIKYVKVIAVGNVFKVIRSMQCES